MILSRRAGAWAGTSLGAATLLHYLPSVCVLGQWSPVRLTSLPGGLCRWRGPEDSDALTLTFDDGPSPESTPRTLDLLDSYEMHATFFVLGAQAEGHRELIAEIQRRGHSIGSHGHRHEHHLLRTPSWIRRDLAQSMVAFEKLGVRPRWYRPTYGQLTARTVLEARRNDMEVVLWSAWGREWAESSPEPVMARLEPRLEPGAIVLLHDNEVSCPPGTAARTHEVLGMLADKLHELKLRSVTLDELVGPPHL